MAYVKQTWIDGQTPLDASHMNHIEDGVEQLSEEITELAKKIEDDQHENAFTVRGAVVNVANAKKAPAIALESSIEVKQLGSGKPSTTNVRGFETRNVLNLYHEVVATSDDATPAITVNIDGSVYGGTIDWLTGKITVTKAGYTFTGGEGWTQPASNRFTSAKSFSNRLMNPDSSYTGLLCDRYVAEYGSGEYCRWNTTQGDLFQVCNSQMTLEEFTAMLAANPMTIVYDVVPFEIYVDSNMFELYAGKNAIWSDCGITSLTYTASDGEDSLEDMNNSPLNYGLPVLRLSGDVTEMTKETSVNLFYDYNGMTGSASVKWQGSSSLNYVKKNYTIKFDTAFEAKEGWGAQKKYCFKANWIDASHARNVVSAKLWGQIVASRTPADATLAACPNYGAVDGFPCIIILNGEFHGLYTWNIPKDGWMYAMDDGENEAIVGADQHSVATQFKGEATFDGDFELVHAADEDNAGWVKTSLDTLINACINSDGSDLDTTIAQRLDWGSAIDYYAFICLMRADDNTDKNYLLFTRDGTKWAFGAYDMDGTWGLNWAGKAFQPARTSTKNSIDGFAELHRVMELIKTYKAEEFKARYNYLRNNALSEDNVATMFANFIAQIPAEIYALERQKWPGIPSTAANDLHQIVDWYRRRVLVIDKQVEAM